MSPQGSNELNLLLKSKVVKVKVELDIKGSKLAGQVNAITRYLQDKRVKLKVELLKTGLVAEVNAINTFLKGKKVKLGVEFKVNKTELNGQITAINTLLKGNGFKKIKVDLDIDIKGSASKIKKQLASINKEISEFNNKYRKVLEDTQKINNKLNSGNVSKGIINPNTLANSVKEAQNYMTKQFGTGIFSSTELKNAEGQLMGFVAQLTKANGVIQKIKYQWNQDSGTFTPINQMTITNTEKNVSQALKSLRELDREILKLSTNQNKFWAESGKLQQQGMNGTLTTDAVNALRARIKEEQVLENKIREENTLLREQKKLIAQIQREQKQSNSSSYRTQLGGLKSSVKNLDLSDVDAKGLLKGLENNFKNLSQGYSDATRKEKEYQNVMKGRAKLLHDIQVLEKTQILHSGDGVASKRYVAETKEMAKAIKTVDQYNEALKRMNKTNDRVELLKIDNNVEAKIRKLESVMYRYASATGKSLSTIETRIEQVKGNVKRNIGEIQYEIERYTGLTERHKAELDARQKLQQREASLVKNVNHGRVRGFIDDNDNKGLKEYIANLNNAKVAMLKLQTDSKGISRITAQFESTGKTAKQVVYEMDSMDNQLRRISTADVFNANRNLGFFEQLKIAMARVPIWTIAMTAFYGSIRSIQNVTNEVLMLDKAMTELRRVADSQINVESMFEGAVSISKELGNNIHDVMKSVNELARTFGHFNERQLLAITNTATLMSNVSDLTAQEATESLVGTMNAFNITAEDSIRIVDSMNEVDNNYAISTKQLAEGMAKSASTAKTFGVTLEENIGHITAIGAVTMESGSIIGNSLKTIYSRITTMDDVGGIFEGLGISMRDAEGDMRDVSDLLRDLSGVWFELSDAERQNYAVKIAGRYQLSRFLALMNNYTMAIESTDTALSSQGSATRENAKYLESFEARINSLKNSFTEMSASIGEAFLESGLSVGIDALTALANGTSVLIDKVGVLGVTFGALGLALYKFGALSFIWKSTTSSMTSLYLGVLLARDGFVHLGVTARSTLSAVTSGTMTATGAIRTMGVAIKTAFGFLKSAMLSTGILAGFVILGVLIEKLVSHISKVRQESAELKKMNDTMIKSYRDSGDGMKYMYDRYKELNDMKEDNIELTSEESSELSQLTSQFAEQLPLAVDHYNAQGEAILKSTDAIKEQIEAVAKLSKEQAKLKDLQLTENIKESVKDYDDLAKEMTKTEKKIEMFKRHSDKYGVDNSKGMQQAMFELMQLEQQRQGYMSDLTKTISSQIAFYVEGNSNMGAFGDNQLKLIENFVKTNDSILMATESEEELEQVSLKVVEVGKQVADVFTDAYDIMSQKLNTEELAEYRQLLEDVSSSVPESLLEVNPYSKKEVQELTDGIKEFINVSHHVEAGSDNFDLLHDRLMNVGYSEQEATKALGELANQFGNAEIQAGVLANSTDDAREAIAEMKTEAIDAMSPIEALFGISSDNVNGLVENLKLYQAMLEEFDYAEAMNIEGFRVLQEQLQGFLQATPDEIQENIDAYIELGLALKDFELIDDGGWKFNWDKFMSGLSGDALEIAKAWRDSGASVEMFKAHLESATGSAEEYNYEKEKLKEPFELGKIETKPIERVGMLAESEFNKHKDLMESLKGGFADISATSASIEVASQHLGNMSGNLSEAQTSVDDLGGSQVDLAKNSETQFGRVSSTIDTHTGLSMTALKALDTQLGTTSGFISGIMGNIGSLSSSIGSLESGIQRVKNLSSSIPKNVTQQSYEGVTTSNNTSDSVASAVSSFSATAEGLSSAMSSGGAGEGTSGVIKSPTPLFSELNFYTSYNKAVNKSKSSGSGSSSSSSSAKKSSTSKSKKSSTSSDKKKKAEELAELYVYDLLDRKRTRLQGTLSQLEAKLGSLSKNSLKYRSAMAEVFNYEQSILKLNQKELANLQKRNKQIATRLKALGDTSKHTKKQRDEYNKLQQEFDSNLGTISQLKGTIASSMIELKKVSEEMFMDSVEALMISLDRRVDTIVKRIEEIDFEIELLDIVDPENDSEKVDLLSTKVRDLYKEQWQYQNNMKKMEKELADAVKRYGRQSDAVKSIVEKMEEYEDAWKNVTLEIKKTEKEISNIRGKAIDGMIDSIKDYYEKMIDKSNDAYDNEIKNAKKAHEDKMKWYDDEEKRISEIYDKRIKDLDDDSNKEQHEEEVSNRNKELSKLQEKASTYQGDTSLEGRKKYAELQEQIAEKEKELADYMKKYHMDKLKEKLNEEKEAELKELEDKKKIDQDSHDTLIERLEDEKKLYEEKIKTIIDNEKEWAKVREELVKGNFTVVKTLLTDMGIDVKQLADGTFDILSKGFSEYSEEIRTFVTEVSGMITKINDMAQSAYGKTSGLTGDKVFTGETVKPANVSEIIRKAYAGTALKDATPDKQQLYNIVKNSDISEKQMNEIWKKAQDGKPLSVPTPEKTRIYNLFRDIIKNRQLSIKSFDTGGYTGDNVPKSGALALLHNKELVLNEQQTSHILDAVKLINKVQSVLPNISRNSIEDKFATASGFTNNNFYELNVNIDRLNGDKDGATLVVKEIMKGLKKLGR